jgi:unsaturated rhamnogalacturonyl hydrolase
MRFIFSLFVILIAGAAMAAPDAPDADAGRGKVVGLDYFFNHQVKDGVQFHYIWDDVKNSGYSKFGEVWKQEGASLAKLATAPTRKDLDRFSIYIIVNPSTEKNAADHKPNYIQPADVDAIAGWVNDGGVLALMGNDKNNCEFDHLNQLAGRFGIHFNGDLRNAVPTHQEMARGVFSIFPDHPLFKDVNLIYMKEISTLTTAEPARPLLTSRKEQRDGEDVIMAVSHFGKGLVFAVGDPWVYNESIDVKTPSLAIENRKGAENLARWLLSVAAAPGGG